jgi:hypothetical protein
MKRSDYLLSFSGPQTASERQKEALKQALDIRKFEVETYWKRATYFWACIAVAFAGFFALSSKAEASSRDLSLVACLGFLFSLGWYLVNRGSSSWQNNWEMQVDLLEDEVMGPLYKTHLDRRVHRFWDLAGPYTFSPSRVNTLLSLIVVAAWLFLLVVALRDLWWIDGGRCYALPIGCLALAGAFALFKGGRPKNRQGPKAFEAQSRTYE